MYTYRNQTRFQIVRITPGQANVIMLRAYNIRYSFCNLENVWPFMRQLQEQNQPASPALNSGLDNEVGSKQNKINKKRRGGGKLIFLVSALRRSQFGRLAL